MSPLPRGVRLAAALAILGLAFFLLPPQAAAPLGIILVLGALVGSGPNPAAPIKTFTDLVYGGK